MTSEPSDRELSLEMIQNWTDFAKGTLLEDKWKKFAGQETIKIFNNGRGTSNDISLVNDDAKLKLFKDCHILLLIQTIYRDETNRTAPMKVLRNIIFIELLHLICFGKNKLFHSLSNEMNKLPHLFPWEQVELLHIRMILHANWSRLLRAVLFVPMKTKWSTLFIPFDNE